MIKLKRAQNLLKVYKMVGQQILLLTLVLKIHMLRSRL